jgi:hypothetical protein
MARDTRGATTVTRAPALRRASTLVVATVPPPTTSTARPDNLRKIGNSFTKAKSPRTGRADPRA